MGYLKDPSNPLADPAYTLAEKVREAMDRQACPIAWMGIAYEAVVENFPNPTATAEERDLFEKTFPGYKAMVIDAKASAIAGGRVEQQSNMYKAWLARAALSQSREWQEKHADLLERFGELEQSRSDSVFHMDKLMDRACAALSLERDSATWFDVLDLLEAKVVVVQASAATFEQIMHATDKAHEDGAHHENAYSLAAAGLEAINELEPVGLGEVGQLRAQLASTNADKEAYAKNAIDLQRRVTNADLALASQTKQVHNLRAQLDQAHTLLNLADHALSETSFNSVGEVVEHDQGMRDEVIAKIAAFFAPAGAECTRCGSNTGQACADLSCGFLEDGNGEPDEVERLRAELTELQNKYRQELADNVKRTVRLAEKYAAQLAEADAPLREALECCKNYDSPAVIGAILQAAISSREEPKPFRVPDCPDCACVQDGQCLCEPSKPSAEPSAQEDLAAEKTLGIERLPPVRRAFKPGDIVRYASGSSALVKLESRHAGGWHGVHCLGGYTFVSDIAMASPEEVETYNTLRAETLRKQGRSE